MAATFEIHQDGSGAYRWRLRSSNGQITAVAGEAFASKSSAIRAAEAVKKAAATAEVKQV